VTRAFVVRVACAAALLTLPMIGVGLVAALTGRDLGAGLQPSWLALAVATGAAATLRPRWRPSGAWRRWLAAVAVVLLLSLAGLALAPSGEAMPTTMLRWGKQVVQLAIMAAFVAWPAVALRGDARWRWTARLIVIGALLQAAYGAIQWIDWYHPGALPAGWERFATSNPAILSGSTQLHLQDGFLDVPRLRGMAAEPLYLGSYLLLVLPVVGLTGWPTAGRTAARIVLGMLLVLTWSRGAWLAGAVGLGLAAVMAVRVGGRRPGRRTVVVAVGAGLAFVLLLGAARLDLVLDRLAQTFSRRDWSNLTRLYSMQAAWRAFLLSPLVGVGWGQFGFHFPRLVDAAGLQSQFQWPVVNNFPLQVLCETGLAGFGVLAAGALRLVQRVHRAALAPGERGLRVRACAVATGAVWLQLLTFSQYNLPHLWLAPGLLLAALVEAEGEGA